jgi:hypothetical protein
VVLNFGNKVTSQGMQTPYKCHIKNTEGNETLTANRYALVVLHERLACQNRQFLASRLTVFESTAKFTQEESFPDAPETYDFSSSSRALCVTSSEN